MTLALSFDDGPDPRGTPAVLDALNAAVQVHGYAHQRHSGTTRSGRARPRPGARDDRGRDEVEDSWGHLADYTREVAEERGLTIVGWSTDTHDWRGDTAGHMLAGLTLETGGIAASTAPSRPGR